MKNLLFSGFLVAAFLSTALAQTTYPGRNPAANLPVAKRPAINVLRVASNVADGETVTFGGQVFEVDTASTPTITAGHIRVNCNAGVTPTIFTTAFAAAVNGTNVLGFKYTATRISANEVLITGPGGADGSACTETLAGSNNAWAAATFYGGSNLDPATRHVVVQSRAATATEAALLTMHFVATFPPAAATVQVRDAAGVLVAFDGTVTITGNRIDVLSSGTTNVASTNVVTVTAAD